MLVRSCRFVIQSFASHSACGLARRNKAVALASRVTLAAVLAISSGCRRSDADRPSVDGRLPVLVALGAEPGQAIVAQGQIEPESGVIPIVATPGDRIASIGVTEGQQVKAGDVLGKLIGQSVRELELEVAIARRDEALTKVAAESAAAMAKLDVAKVGLQQAKSQVQQAVKNLATAEAEGGRLNLLSQQLTLAENKLKQLKAAMTEPGGSRLATPSAIEQQQLAVDESRSQLESARREANQNLDDAKLAVQAAEKEVKANELTIESAKAASGIPTMDKQIELLKQQLEATKLVSPIQAKILSIDAKVGEPTTTAPIIRLADTSHMIVRAEVNVVDLQRVQVGAKATLTSAALLQPLTGKVKSISRLVGTPRLPNPNPMARVDWRSAHVVIEIDEASVETAAQRIQLQVDVAIAAEPVHEPAT